MNEHEFEELMKLEKKQNNDLINKKMKLKMKKNMFSSVVIILICLGLMITVIFYGTSFIVKQFYYNPFHEEEIVDVESENDSRRCDNFNALMATFVEMYFPGFMYSHQGSVEDVKLYDHGFAKYDIKTKIHNTFYDLIWDGTNNTTFTIKRSRMSLDTDVKWFYRYAGEFKGVRDVYDPDAISQKTLQEIKDLPKSALLDVSLSFNDVYSAKETVDFINRYPEVQFVWLGLKGEDSDGIANGMAIKNDVQYFLSEETEKKYPTFYLPYEFNEKDLLENHLSQLKFLIDHEDFVDVVSTLYPDFNIESLKQRYEETKKNGIQAIGLRCYVKRDDLLNMIEKDGLEYLRIRDIKLSILQG